MEQELKVMLVEVKAAIKENEQVKKRLEVLYSLLAGLLMPFAVTSKNEQQDNDIQNIHR